MEPRLSSLQHEIHIIIKDLFCCYIFLPLLMFFPSEQLLVYENKIYVGNLNLVNAFNEFEQLNISSFVILYMVDDWYWVPHSPHSLMLLFALELLNGWEEFYLLRLSVQVLDWYGFGFGFKPFNWCGLSIPLLFRNVRFSWAQGGPHWETTKHGFQGFWIHCVWWVVEGWLGFLFVVVEFLALKPPIHIVSYFTVFSFSFLCGRLLWKLWFPGIFSPSLSSRYSLIYANYRPLMWFNEWIKFHIILKQ